MLDKLGLCRVAVLQTAYLGKKPPDPCQQRDCTEVTELHCLLLRETLCL